MMSFKSARSVLILACVFGVASGSVAFAHGGHGGGGHGGGHGGHSGGHSGGHHGGFFGGHHGGHYGGHYGGYRSYGYGGYGYGYGLGYGNYYGYPNYGYGYSGYNSYYSPQYYNYSQPCYASTIVSQPAYPSTTLTSNIAMTNTTQLVSTSSQPSVDGGEIVLFNAPNGTQDAVYTLNGMRFVIKPGMVQRIRNDRTWTIQFGTGTGQFLRYTLSSGKFKFKVEGTGMGLFSTQDQPPMAGQTTNSTGASMQASPSPAPTPAPGN